MCFDNFRKKKSIYYFISLYCKVNSPEWHTDTRLDQKNISEPHKKKREKIFLNTKTGKNNFFYTVNIT